MIPVAIKRDGTTQKFRLPLKYSGQVDLEVEFFFKSSQAINKHAMNRIEVEGNSKTDASPLIFSLIPSVVKF